MYTVHLASARVFVFNIVCFARTKICPGIMGFHNMTVIDIVFVFSQKLSNKVVEFIRKHNDWIKFNLLRKCIVRCLQKKTLGTLLIYLNLFASHIPQNVHPSPRLAT